MKITRRYLQQVIKEELTVALGKTESLEQEGKAAGAIAGIGLALSSLGLASVASDIEKQRNKAEQEIIQILDKHKDVDIFQTLKDAGISVKTLHGSENAKAELARMIVTGRIPNTVEDFPKYPRK